MSAITVTKRIPAGTPVRIFGTGASESASMSLAIFGQQSTAKIDAKILAGDYAIPQDRFDATNFTKVASHPGGNIDTTQPYVEETVSGTNYRYLVNPSARTFRFRDAATNLFAASQSLPLPPAHARDNDATRGLFLQTYAGSILTAKSGTPTKFTDVATLPTAVTKSGFSNNGAGAYLHSASGFAITLNTSGYQSHVINVATGTVRASTTSGASLYNYFYNTYAGTSGQPYQTKLFGGGSYVWAFFVSNFDSYSSIWVARAPITGFADNTTTNPWSFYSQVTFNSGEFTSTAPVTGETIAELNGTVFFLMQPAGGSITNMTLIAAQLDIANGNLNNVLRVATGVDGNFLPIKVGNRLMYRYTSGAAFTVDSNGVVYDATPIPRTTNAKTVSVNYVNYNKYKWTDGISASDGLAYFTDGSGSFNQNGISFWCADGKYSLVRDETLKNLDVVGSDDNWFDRQFSAQKSMRVEYTGMTLAPNQALWVVADKDIQTVAFGYKE